MSRAKIMCREQVPLLSLRVTSAAVILKCILCVDNLCKEHDYQWQHTDALSLFFRLERAAVIQFRNFQKLKLGISNGMESTPSISESLAAFSKMSN